MIPRPRGTRDILPDEMEARVRAFAAMRRSAALHGYREVETPTFELAELFIARSGEEVIEQMYTFEDRGGRLLALRPELTAPIARLYSSEMRSDPKPLRLFYFGRCYRYERPQRGRYREFTQFGAELIGDDSAAANADIISLAVHCIASVGLPDAVLRVGDLRVLRAILGDRATPEVMRLIDKRDPALREALPDVADLLLAGDLDDMRDSVGGDLTSELERLLGHLEIMGIDAKVDVGIARGLDYYNGLVFEIDAPNLGAERQICGGGSYDLGGVVGVGDLRATGFAIGVDRLLLVAAPSPPPTSLIDAYVVPLEDAAIGPALAISADLRRADVRTETVLTPIRPARAMKTALARGAAYAVFIGEEELAGDAVSVRDLAEKRQEMLARDAAVVLIRKGVRGD